MKKLLAVLALLVPMLAVAQDPPEWVGYDNRWYAGVMGGGVMAGDNRRAGADSPYLGVFLGRFMSPNFSLDLQLDTYELDFEPSRFGSPPVGFPTDDDFELMGYGVTGRWHFRDPSDRARPFMMVGLGIAEHDSIFDKGRDMYVSWGGGVRAELGDNGWLRAQVEARYDNDRETFNSKDGFIDVIGSIGLGWSFGPKPRKPAPAPAPEPRRAAPPPPPPAPTPAPEPEPVMQFEFDSTVLFAFDSAELRNEARAELDAAAEVLAPRDDLVRIDVEGHTDSVGAEAYNQTLSERRAAAVADYLASAGVDRDRMQVIGYGESRPKVANDTAPNRAENRRVVISAYNQ